MKFTNAILSLVALVSLSTSATFAQDAFDLPQTNSVSQSVAVERAAANGAAHIVKTPPVNKGVIVGVSTRTVGGCNLANLEALLNIIANGTDIVFVVAGLGSFFKLLKVAERPSWKKRVSWGTGLMTAGMLTPAAINYCVATARDLNLLS